MATLCAIMLAENGYAVRLWSAFPRTAEELARTRENRRFLPGHRLPEAVEVTADAATALEGATVAIQAVPTQFVRVWWSQLAPHCPQELPICSTAKGIENRTLLRPSQVVLEVLGDADPTARAVAVLSGPSHRAAGGPPPAGDCDGRRQPPGLRRADPDHVPPAVLPRLHQRGPDRGGDRRGDQERGGHRRGHPGRAGRRRQRQGRPGDAGPGRDHPTGAGDGRPAGNVREAWPGWAT